MRRLDTRFFKLALLLGLLCVLPAHAQAPVLPQLPFLPTKSVAYLVVNDRHDPAQVNIVKQIAAVVTDLRNRYPSMTKDKLPVIRYFWDKPDERAYCEKVLHITGKDLVFIGIAATNHEGAVVKVLYRVNAVQDPKSQGYAVFQQVCLSLGLNPEALNAHPKAPTRQVENDNGRIGFSSFFTTDADGNVQHDFKTTDGAVCFSLFVQNMTTDRAHSHHIQVDVLDANGKPVLRPLGGLLSLAKDQQCLSEDVLHKADVKGSNGFAIKDTKLGAEPGNYTVKVSLDGQEVYRDKFTIEPSVVKIANGQLGVLQCFVGDDQGVARTSFTPTDTGAFVFMVLENLAQDVKHDHTIEVKCEDADGHSLGRALGGAFTVAAGEDLSKKEFPGDVDPTGGNGALIKGAPLQDRPGDYKFVVELDGAVVKELPFTIKPAQP
ncbi:MAG TPA: hypothetical protein VGO93_12995 [Candidatus Xenobia bacterium]|jgi:hypothetical protein